MRDTANRNYRRNLANVPDVPDLLKRMQAAFNAAVQHYGMPELADPNIIADYMRQVTESPSDFNHIMLNLEQYLSSLYKQKLYREANMMRRSRHFRTTSDYAAPVGKGRQVQFQDQSESYQELSESEEESEEESEDEQG